MNVWEDDDHAAVWGDAPSSSTTSLNSPFGYPATLQTSFPETPAEDEYVAEKALDLPPHPQETVAVTPSPPLPLPSVAVSVSPPRTLSSAFSSTAAVAAMPNPLSDLFGSKSVERERERNHSLFADEGGFNAHSRTTSNYGETLSHDRAHETRSAADNASIIPIAPSETGTIRSLVEDDLEDHSIPPLHGGAASPLAPAFGGHWGSHPSETTPSVLKTQGGGFSDPLQSDPLMGSDTESGYGVSAKKEEERKDDADLGIARAEYDFEVNVSEPQKVGNDPINAHVSYKVRTKTNAPNYRNGEFSVNRRYRDFLWLYNSLSNRHPGVVVPPVPEKHAIGRFQDEFVEARRLALERCLRKIVVHPLLQSDEDLQMFLESESFTVDIASKKRGLDLSSAS
ncbi:Vacuolar protein sorting-associated protein 5, partial [Irineochytrium annulatum]